MNQTIPFTVDHVGSFLRPKSIKEARQRVKEGTITKEELREIENEEIKKISSEPKGSWIKGNH